MDSRQRTITVAIIILIALSCFAYTSMAEAAYGAKKRSSSLKVIVIDPGHGGKDTGAVSRSGFHEKDITLRVARALKRELQEKLGVKVVLTRNADIYLTLEERTEKANKLGADLFISIHVNSAFARKANGIETFFLSYEASDNDAQRLAARENNVIKLEGITPETPKNDISAILWDLTQTEAHHQSSSAAEYINVSLARATGSEDRGVKQAPFIVLMGATMPAVLVEIGFISNPFEEKRLKSKKRQRFIAAAISDGIVKYERSLRSTPGYVKK